MASDKIEKWESCWPPNDDLIEISRKEEGKLLSILLSNKDCLADIISSDINKNCFRFYKNSFLYSLIEVQHQKFESLLTLTAIESLMDKQSSMSDEMKTSAKGQWVSANSLESDPEDYSMLKKNLVSRYKQKRLYEELQDIKHDIVDSVSGQDEMVDKFNESLTDIMTVNEESHCRSVIMKDAMDEVWDHIIDRREHPEKEQGILTGLKGLDEKLFGLKKKSYTVVAGIVNGGKTTLMFNVAFNMAYGGHHVLYVSMEKLANPLFERLLAMHALVDVNRISRGGKGEDGLNDFSLGKLEKARDDIIKTETWERFTCVEMLGNTPLSKILHEIDRWLKKNPLIDVLVVDYLGCIKHESKHSSRPDLDLADTSRRLQAYGKKNDLATITAVQIKNASTEKIKSKAKGVSSDDEANNIQVGTEDLAGSQAVIADADIGLSIILNQDNPPTKAFVNFTKARENESKVTAVFDFDGKTGKISDKIFSPGQVVDIDDAFYGDDNIDYDKELYSDVSNAPQESLSIIEDTTDDIFESNSVDADKIDDIFNDKDDKDDKSKGSAKVVKPNGDWGYGSMSDLE